MTKRNSPYNHIAMTFDEIGRVLGITRGGAWMLYKSAMRKLRRKQQHLETMRQLAASKENVK